MQAYHVSATKEGFVAAHFAFHLAGLADYASGLAVQNIWRGDSSVTTFLS